MITTMISATTRPTLRPDAEKLEFVANAAVLSVSQFRASVAAAGDDRAAGTAPGAASGGSCGCASGSGVAGARLPEVVLVGRSHIGKTSIADICMVLDRRALAPHEPGTPGILRTAQ